MLFWNTVDLSMQSRVNTHAMKWTMSSVTCCMFVARLLTTQTALTHCGIQHSFAMARWSSSALWPCPHVRLLSRRSAVGDVWVHTSAEFCVLVSVNLNLLISFLNIMCVSQVGGHPAPCVPNTDPPPPSSKVFSHQVAGWYFFLPFFCLGRFEQIYQSGSQFISSLFLTGFL